MNIENFSFDNSYAFFVFILLVVLSILAKTNDKSYESIFSKDMLSKMIIGSNSKKRNFILMIISFVFLIIALARPVISNKPITISENSISLVVAFDISKSMSSEDVYPNRLAFAKNKFVSLLSNFKDEKIGAIGFSSRSFLIAPITNDYLSLKYLVKNINSTYISATGSDVYEALQSTNNLLKNNKQKALIVFTDGTDETDFTKSIEFANQNHIKVFVYAIATQKGGIIKTKDGIQKDHNGNIVVTRLNNSIKELAFGTNGAYLEYSNSTNDIKEFVDMIKERFKEDKKQKDITINTNQELFLYPLAFSLFFIFISFVGFSRIKR
jgi:Ca-activated chloride channel family protein